MRTVVFQSYRTHDVPAWIGQCMASVRDWAGRAGFQYRFYDDQLLARAPDWLRRKAGVGLCPVTDYARLEVAGELLREGHDRAVWVDADVLVFAPDRMTVDVTGGFGFCHEIWLAGAGGEVSADHRVNNSVSVFERGSAWLDVLRDLLLRRARELPSIDKLDLGTRPLTALRGIAPFHLFEHVGMFGPRLMADIDEGAQGYLVAYGRVLEAPLAAANLCASLVGGGEAGPLLDAARCERVVARCLRTRGEVVNRHVHAGRAVPVSAVSSG